MKITLCSWCDRTAQHKTRDQGERDNSDACCAVHYAMYFARHKAGVLATDTAGPSWIGPLIGQHARIEVDFR